jgi:hypothetical protein
MRVELILQGFQLARGLGLGPALPRSVSHHRRLCSHRVGDVSFGSSHVKVLTKQIQTGLCETQFLQRILGSYRSIMVHACIYAGSKSIQFKRLVGGLFSRQVVPCSRSLASSLSTNKLYIECTTPQCALQRLAVYAVSQPRASIIISAL